MADLYTASTGVGLYPPFLGRHWGHSDCDVGHLLATKGHREEGDFCLYLRTKQLALFKDFCASLAKHTVVIIEHYMSMVDYVSQVLGHSERA